MKCIITLNHPVSNKENIIKKKLNEKILIDIANNNFTDFNIAFQKYKEIINAKDSVEYHKDLVDKAFLALSNKKSEMITIELKKISGKDNNGILKILEEVKLNNWKINQDLMSKLIAMSVASPMTAKRTNPK